MSIKRDMERRREMEVPVECPFCGYRNPDLYAVTHHIEKSHADPSPFVAEQEIKRKYTRSTGRNNQIPYSYYEYYGGGYGEMETYVTCPEKGCGLPVILAELQNHMDMHGAERLAMSDMREARPSSAKPTSISSIFPWTSSSSSSKTITKHSHPRSDNHSQKHRASESFSKPSSSSSSHVHHKKSAKSELGPYAREKQMPAKLYEELLKGPRMAYQNRIGLDGRLARIELPSNETPDLIPLIAQLVERDPTVKWAWLCDPAVRHICKQLPREGGFCGYRNIQMLITYIRLTYHRGTHPFSGVAVPTIIKLQHDIEKGWDNGINVNGRAETGGILGTRKYIGTSEAETYFTVQGIHCRAMHIGRRPPDKEGHDALFDFVERWYEAYRPAGNTDRVLRTTCPPIYFQHAGHSMTIIGLERRIDGSRNILVFDPTYATSPAMSELLAAKKIKPKVKSDSLLAAYRRGVPYLRRYNEFELLLLQ